MAKKRHPFAPQGYLKHFVDGSGFVHVIRKDSPDKAFLQKPDSFAFHKYHYAQPLPGGGRDTDALENLFSELEGKWPPIIERLSRRENVNDELEAIFKFIALQRGRVPAMRDAIEIIEAARVKSRMKVMAAAGKLPPPPEGVPGLLDHVVRGRDRARGALRQHGPEGTAALPARRQGPLAGGGGGGRLEVAQLPAVAGHGRLPHAGHNRPRLRRLAGAHLAVATERSLGPARDRYGTALPNRGASPRRSRAARRRSSREQATIPDSADASATSTTARMRSGCRCSF
ncbi:MAG: DUF4238 domain-containing protein [Xanthobacteraceae bacterium]|nr:DUF4238 domain-containing protein [Xanthobacteraceae bacterium]